MPPTNDGNGDQQNPMTPPAQDPGMGGGMGDQGGNMPPAPQPGDSGQAPMGAPPADTPPAQDPGMGGGMGMPGSEQPAAPAEPTDTTGDSGTGAPAA